MKKKQKRYEGTVEEFTSNKIYLNINNLKKGTYKLKIVHKNKTVKSVDFTKK
jgi:hypothetical protein